MDSAEEDSDKTTINDYQTRLLNGDGCQQESDSMLNPGDSSDEVKVKKSSMTREQKILFIIFGLTNLTNELTFSILAPFFPAEAAKQGATKVQVGLIFSVYSLVQFIAAPIIGKFLPTIGCRFAFICGFFVNSGCNILYGFLDRVAPGTEFLVYCILIRSIEAIGTTAFLTALMALVPNKFPDSVGQTMGNIEIFAGIGLTIGPFLGGVLYQLGGFMLPFVAIGGFSMILSLCLFFILPADNHLSEQKTGSFIHLMSIPGTWVVVFSLFIGAAALTFMEPTLSTELQQYNLTPTQVGLVFLLMGLGYTISAPIVGWIADKRQNTRTLLSFGYILAGISYLIAGPWPVLHLPNKLYLITIGVVLMYVALGCAITPTYQDLLSTVVHNGMPDVISTHSVVSGMFNSAFSLGSFFGPTMGGLLVDKFNFAVSSSIFGLLNLISAAGIIVFSLWEFRCGKGRRKTMYVAKFRVTNEDTDNLIDNENGVNSDSVERNENIDETEAPNTVMKNKLNGETAIKIN
ncbi:MFS-type transporter SLC18B1-like [Antedon mediterranea]|uniref:MFS-type transporter SLC18B1-like n=1 Tax=Antedon mediterranea TaxID=105859 RepID=UPI003AF8AE7B